jgi:hypothetical protein
LEFSYSSFGNSILVMRIYGGKSHALTVLFASIQPFVCLEDAVVGVVVLDLHSVPMRVCLECLLSFHCFFRGRRLL